MIESSTNFPSSNTKIVDCHDERSLQNEISSSQLSLLTRYEADHIVQSLQSFPLEEIGSSKFMNMYAYQVERLSLQAHASAYMIRSDPNLSTDDEFVVESILNFEKIPILVQTLLALELWRIHLTDEIQCHHKFTDNHSLTEYDETVPFLTYLALHGNTLRLSFILHVETTLVCLLTLILFRKVSCIDMDGDTAIALVDYCSRQMHLLIAPPAVNDVVRRQKDPLCTQDFAQHIRTRSNLDEIRDNILDTNYKTAVAATCLARYLCEHIDYLALGAQTRILDTHDFLMMFIALTDEPPWTRRRQVQRQSHTSSNLESTIIWEKFMETNEWKEVSSSQLLHVTKYEAQCWLSIFHLISSNASRQQYEFNTFRKDQLLRIRKFLNEVTIDQIPVLADVMQFINQISIMTVPDSTTGVGSAFLLQEVDKIRESLIEGKAWDNIFKTQIDQIFSQIKDLTDPDLRLISTIYDEDSYASIVEGTFANTDCEPLDIIRLRCFDKIHHIWKDVCTFRSEQVFSVIDTPAGPFRRSKLEITQSEHSMKLQLEDKVEAAVYFGGVALLPKILHSEVFANSTTATETHRRKKVWCQLGSLDEHIVLQICLSEFSNAEHGYRICQAFLCQPHFTRS